MKICEMRNKNLTIIKSYQKGLFQFGIPPWTRNRKLRKSLGSDDKD